MSDRIERLKPEEGNSGYCSIGLQILAKHTDTAIDELSLHSQQCKPCMDALAAELRAVKRAATMDRKATEER